jgi:polysaccharide biosynthesis/export protein
MSRMTSRIIPAFALAAVLAGGCAHDPMPGPSGGILDGWFPRHDRMMTDAAIAPAGYPISPIAEPMPVSMPMHGGSTLAWGEPTVMPAGIVGPQAVADTDGRYLLDTGDRLRLFVYGQPNLSRLYTVDHEGKISVPLIGNIRVRGMTTYGVEATVRQKLGTQFVKDPQVTVDVQQNRPFFILGEVRSAGQYPFVSGMTVQTAVAIAGGYSERANERRARITRRINGMVEVIEVPPDYVVQAGDTVYVHERLF